MDPDGIVLEFAAWMHPREGLFEKPVPATQADVAEPPAVSASTTS
jgi:hypothetical protein